MSKNKGKKVNLRELTPEEQLKYEIAEELGVLDQIIQNGWQCLTAKETGKIGGMLAKRKKNISGN